MSTKKIAWVAIASIFLVIIIAVISANPDSPLTLTNYLQQLFNYKNRLTSIKANFPTSLITNLKLNDRLIIRDKRYIINNIKTNLTSGEVDLELLNDFREISNANVTNELLPIG